MLQQGGALALRAHVGAGGQAAINIDGATVQASLVAAYASGQGGEGGGFNNIFSFSGVSPVGSKPSDLPDQQD